MPSVTDNDLDKLFREAADRNVPEFDPQDWEDMARRLEHEERAATIRSKSLYTLVVVLLLHTLLLQWDQSNNIQHASIFEAPTSPEVAGEISSGKERSAHKEMLNPSTPGKDKSSNSHEVIKEEQDDINASIRIINSLRQKTENADQNINKRIISKPVLKNTNLQSSSNELPNTLTQSDNGLTTGISISEAAGRLNSNAPVALAGDDDLIRSDNEAIASGNRGLKKVDLTKNMPSYDLSPPKSNALKGQVTEADKIIKPVENREDVEQPTTIIQRDRSTSSQRWFIKIPISPDFSAIDYDKLGKPGINIGL
ncbi:MAG: hypothetical protein C0490_06755, partial [Marivirga sp.]|nr:hypothetical protein [Marivirga sp.]